MKAKIFGIGFHKTGTSSLAQALRILGYRVAGPNQMSLNAAQAALEPQQRQAQILANIAALVPQYDAFQDNPWPLFFRELDATYPGSKFILTRRAPIAWFASIQRHFGGKSTPMREWIYGAGYGDPLGHGHRYIERYQRHNAAVLSHFRDRPQDLLVLEITQGEGWAKLCPFLHHPLPRQVFPHANRASDRERGRESRPALKARIKHKVQILTWRLRERS